MYMITADYSLTDYTLEGKTFETTQAAWRALAVDLASSDAGFSVETKNNQVEAALALSNETGLLSMSDGCNAEVVEVEAYKVAGSNDLARWIPRLEMWVDQHGNEIDVSDLTLERVVD